VPRVHLYERPARRAKTGVAICNIRMDRVAGCLLANVSNQNFPQAVGFRAVRVLRSVSSANTRVPGVSERNAWKGRGADLRRSMDVTPPGVSIPCITLNRRKREANASWVIATPVRAGKARAMTTIVFNGAHQQTESKAESSARFAMHHDTDRLRGRSAWHRMSADVPNKYDQMDGTRDAHGVPGVAYLGLSQVAVSNRSNADTRCALAIGAYNPARRHKFPG